MRFLIADSEPADARAERRASVGQSAGERFCELLSSFYPDVGCEQRQPSDGDDQTPPVEVLAGYDAVFLTGSPIHVYQDSPEVARELAFMRAVFASGTPSFGSCAGLQVAVAAAGGTVRPITQRHEAGFARNIAPTEAGRNHPLLAGRPGAYDAPAIHSDEVERLPDGATLLASNAVTTVQAAEIRCGPGVFWGVQYHPELSMHEVAAALLRQKSSLATQGLVRDPDEVDAYAAAIDTLHHDPARLDLAWRLGLDAQVIDPTRRSVELRNFVERLVRPAMRERGRG